jgi:uncharacterized protein (DUF1501 family)
MTTRRVFLKSSGMAMLSLGFAPSFLARTAQAAGARRKLLIAIFQRGAVDGLNMIVPFGEAEYYRLRPSIAILVLRMPLLVSMDSSACTLEWPH